MEKLSNEDLIELIKSGDPKESWDAEYELKTRLDYYGETLEQIVVLANKMLEGK